jgi:hypothetical protein
VQSGYITNLEQEGKLLEEMGKNSGQSIRKRLDMNTLFVRGVVRDKPMIRLGVRPSVVTVNTQVNNPVNDTRVVPQISSQFNPIESSHKMVQDIKEEFGLHGLKQLILLVNPVYRSNYVGDPTKVIATNIIVVDSNIKKGVDADIQKAFYDLYENGGRKAVIKMIEHLEEKYKIV